MFSGSKNVSTHPSFSLSSGLRDHLKVLEESGKISAGICDKTLKWFRGDANDDGGSQLQVISNIKFFIWRRVDSSQTKLTLTELREHFEVLCHAFKYLNGVSEDPTEVIRLRKVFEMFEEDEYIQAMQELKAEFNGKDLESSKKTPELINGSGNEMISTFFHVVQHYIFRTKLLRFLCR